MITYTKGWVDINKPNILIIGKTGAGKSSVINYVFGREVAPVGNVAEPMTRGIIPYDHESFTIYDSEGYELGDDKQRHYERLILDSLAESEYHIVWYAIPAADKRITELDIKLIKRIKREGFPVCLLLTKVDEPDEKQLNDMLATANEKLAGVNVFRLSVNANNNPALAASCNWKKLVDYSIEKAEQYLLKLKREEANTIITKATVAAGAVALSPIPFSDAALLVPIQTAMIFKIFSIYGVSLGKAVVTNVASAVLTTAIGQSFAGNLLKFIPFVGSIGGAIINTGVATAITGILGNMVADLCESGGDIERKFSSSSFIVGAVQKFKER
ncbi:GTP-binding protein [Deferribacterales bacterium RsTz2092]|nr:GTPase [Deferribacterales bacterium]